MGLEQLALLCSWLGTFILVTRGLPQALKSWRDGHSRGLSAQMLWLWLLGSILVLPHLLLLYNVALILVYCANIVFILVMLKYFYFPRESQKNKGEGE